MGSIKWQRTKSNSPSKRNPHKSWKALLVFLHPKGCVWRWVGGEMKWGGGGRGSNQGRRQQENPAKQICYVKEFNSNFFNLFSKYQITTGQSRQNKVPWLITTLAKHSLSTMSRSKALFRVHPLHPKLHQKEHVLVLHLYRFESHCNEWELCYWQEVVPVKLWRVPIWVSEAGKHHPHCCLAFLFQSFLKSVKPHPKAQRFLWRPQVCWMLPPEPEFCTEFGWSLWD